MARREPCDLAEQRHVCRGGDGTELRRERERDALIAFTRGADQPLGVQFAERGAGPAKGGQEAGK